MKILNKQGIPFYGDLNKSNSDEIRCLLFLFAGEPTADLLDAPLITEIVVQNHELGHIHRTESQRGIKAVSGSKFVPQYGATLHYPKKVVPVKFDAVEVGSNILNRPRLLLDSAGHMTVDQRQRISAATTSNVTFEGTPTLDGIISITNGALSPVTMTVGAATGTIGDGSFSAALSAPVTTAGNEIVITDTGTSRIGAACTASLTKGTEIINTVTVTNGVLLCWKTPTGADAGAIVEPYRMDFPVGKTGENTFIELRETELSTGEYATVTNVRAGV